MICGICDKNGGVCYPSYPPKYKCAVTDEFHPGDYECDLIAVHSSKKPIIYIDCDDTIENFCEVWIRKLNEKYKTEYTIEDVTDWNMDKLFPNVTKEELLAIADEEDFWKEVLPYDNAQSSLLTLSKLANVYLVTTGSAESIYYKIKYVIRKYFWFIPKENFIVCDDRSLLMGTILIDDNPIHGEEFSGNFFLMDRPHNKNIIERDGWVRVYNWKQIVSMVLNLWDFL